MRFALRRAALGLCQLIGVSLLAFGLLELAPGDYLDEMKVDPQLAPETLDQWREQYGLNQGVAARYGKWAQSVLRGEFGMSLAYGRPVSELLRGRLWNTLRLALCALALAWLTAVPLGAWCAAHPQAWAARSVGAAVSAVLALPDLLVALLALALPLWSGIGPVSGRMLPAAVALALVTLPPIFRHTRSSVSQTLALPFVEHLRACGVGERRILARHVLPAAMLPIIPLFGLSLGGLTSASLVVEVVLSWPGMGPLLLESILARDAAVVMAAVLLASCLLVFGNLLADLLLYAADPRIRAEEP